MDYKGIFEVKYFYLEIPLKSGCENNFPLKFGCGKSVEQIMGPVWGGESNLYHWYLKCLFMQFSARKNFENFTSKS